MNQKKFVHPNITTLRKCTTLKYLAKVNRFPCFISMHVQCDLCELWVHVFIFWVHNKNFDDLQHFLNCTKKT